MILQGVYIVYGKRRSYECESVITWRQRIALTYIKLLVFSYKNIATFCILLVNCVQIRSSNVLFIYGNLECFQQWQIGIMAFLGIWVIPFPAALMLSYRLLIAKFISFKEFIICTIFPAVTMYYYLARDDPVISPSTEERQKILVADLRECMEEPYRRIDGSDDSYVFWESWRLYQRLILVFVTAFSINPIIQAVFTTYVIAFFITVFAIVDPYKKELYVLRLMEIASLAGLSLSLGELMFNTYVYNLQLKKDLLERSLKILRLMDMAISPIHVLVFCYIVEPAYQKLCALIQKIFSGERLKKANENHRNIRPENVQMKLTKPQIYLVGNVQLNLKKPQFEKKNTSLT